jgi:SAM-dependent methyltransferase
VKYGYAIGRCLSCGLIYANPRAPAAKILARYSPDYFWHEYLPSLGVVDGKYDLAPFDARHALLLRMLGERTRGRRLLEIGAGAGFFLKAATRAGWTVAGIELSEEAARFARERLELDVGSVPAESMAVADRSYDAVAMFEVIEHLFDPRAVLLAAARALGPQGTLVVSTPNYDAASRHMLGIDWAVLSPLEHVYYFREESLRRLLEATGFTDVVFERVHAMWGPMETANFRYTHAPGGWRARTAEVLVRGGGMPLARLLQRAGRQDTLLCFARKAG